MNEFVGMKVFHLKWDQVTRKYQIESGIIKGRRDEIPAVQWTLTALRKLGMCTTHFLILKPPTHSSRFPMNWVKPDWLFREYPMSCPPCGCYSGICFIRNR